MPSDHTPHPTSRRPSNDGRSARRAPHRNRQDSHGADPSAGRRRSSPTSPCAAPPDTSGGKIPSFGQAKPASARLSLASERVTSRALSGVLQLIVAITLLIVPINIAGALAAHAV